jgi:hypothetical protein
MRQNLKTLFRLCIEALFTTWIGPAITLLTTGSASLWLASKTPIISQYAPFSYLIAVLLALLCVSALLWVWKEVSVTTLPSFYEAYYMDGDFRNIQKKNIQDILIEPDINTKTFHMTVIFKRKVKHPSGQVTEESGLRIKVLNSNCNPGFVKIEIEIHTHQNANGRFRIDFNQES